VTHIKGEPVARLRADVLGADVPLDRIPALVAELGGHARWLNEGITQ